MKLKDKLEVEIMHLPLTDDVINAIGIELEQRAEYFTIGFTEWKDVNFSMYRDKTYYANTSSKYFDITKYAGKEKHTKYYITKELLEIYKETL